MKRNMLISVAGLALATVLLVSASVWVFENRPTIWGHTEGMTQEEIMEKLHQLTIAEFLKDFDQAMDDIQTVSYTHLDVYKRQVLYYTTSIIGLAVPQKRYARPAGRKDGAYEKSLCHHRTGAGYFRHGGRRDCGGFQLSGHETAPCSVI